MVYGIDECRRCGKAMPPAGPDQLARYEFAKRQKSVVPEAQWRAEGWKVAPSNYQVHHILDGVCRDCKWELGNRATHKGRLVAIILAAAAALAVLIYFVETIFK